MAKNAELSECLIPRLVYLCAKNVKKKFIFVPTGRVIKYPTKCALFPVFQGPPVPGPGEALDGGPQDGVLGRVQNPGKWPISSKIGPNSTKEYRKGVEKWPIFGPKRGFRALPRDPQPGPRKGPRTGVARGSPGEPPPDPGSRPRAPRARGGGPGRGRVRGPWAGWGSSPGYGGVAIRRSPFGRPTTLHYPDAQ